MVRIRLLALFFALLATPSYADDAVQVRSSAKDDYTRIVFEWPKAPSYVTDKTASSLTLKFQSAATFKIEGAAPTGQPRITSYSNPDGKTAVIGFTSGQDVRHFEIGNRVIVDIRGSAVTAKAAPAKAAEIKAETKKEPALLPPKVAPVPVAKVEPAMPAQSDPILAEPSAAATAAPFEIELTSTEMMGIAVYKRFGNLWIIVDSANVPVAPKLAGDGAKKFGTFERIPLKEATAFRLALPDERALHVSGGGLVWKITAEDVPASFPATAFKRISDAATKTISLLWPVPGARRVIDVNDPVAGDTLKVATVDAAKYYSGTVQDYAEFGMLQSFAGLAVESKIDNLDIKKTPQGILIGTQQGLAVSPDNDTAFMTEPPVQKSESGKPLPTQTTGTTKAAASPVPGNALFKFNDWKMGDAKAVEDNRRILMSNLANKDDQSKAQDLLKLAKMELAYGRGPEAGGYLDLAGQFVPDLLPTPEFLALTGAAKALSGDDESGLKDFSNESLKDFSETALWKAYTLAGLEDWKQAGETLPDNFATLAGYPDPVRIPLALGLTEAALRNGDLVKADALMKLAETKDMILPYQSALDYMRGEKLRQEGKADDAEKIWTKLKDGKDDLYRAKAGLALTTLQIDKKQVKPAEAIDRLEGLRYAWRGDELETSVNYKLGQLYIANNDPLKGLALMRQAASLSPDSEQGRKISAEMASTFAHMFDPNKLKDVNPVDAISLYNEFSNLAPQGPANDKIVRQLADRLADADLLPRAASLLQGQIDGGKLQGTEAVTTAIHLASIYIQDNKPDKGIAVLDKAVSLLGAGAASQPALTRQIALLRAEALSEQKKPEEAFVILARLDQNEEVLRLRADIGWSNQRWQDASDSLQALVEKMQVSPTRPATEEEAALMLNWAVALYLADNRYVLANLREKYSTAMAATSKAKQFEVVTRPRQSALLADRDTINSIIEETDIFKGFVDSSRASNTAATTVPKPQTAAQTIAPVSPAIPPQAVETKAQ